MLLIKHNQINFIDLTLGKFTCYGLGTDSAQM